MSFSETGKWLAVFFLLVISKFLLAQIPGSLEITYNGKDTIRYCSDSVPVAPDISIKGTDFDSDNGIRISFANYIKGEDTLVYNGKMGFKWDNQYGYLELIGPGKASDFQQAVKNVFYKNLAEKPTSGARSVSITLKDADYLPLTQHFYRFIKKPGIYWTAAKDSAEAPGRRYFGLQGYLATITSSEENDFIWSKLTGIGWIGASDSEKEGEWKWMTGPEKGNKFYDHSTRTTFPGWFTYWNSDEPNNVQKSWGADEDYAHINLNPGTIPHSWNDLSNESDGPSSLYYYSQGYIVEYGGMPGDPVLKLWASVKLMIDKIPFSEQRDFTVCQGTGQKLNLDASGLYNYFWSPQLGLSDPGKSNPVAIPMVTTKYMAVGKFGNYCIDTAYFTVNVNALPVHSWQKEYIICNDELLKLDPGNHFSYLWNDNSTNRYLTTNKEGWYAVKITDKNNCLKTDSTNVKVSRKPLLNYAGYDTIVCGAKNEKLKLSFDKQGISSLLSTIQTGVSIVDASTLNPEIMVSNYGKYKFQLRLTDGQGCNYYDSLKVEFHNQPKADYLLDTEKCQGYNLEMNFTGTTIEPAIFRWFSNDTVYTEGIDRKKVIIPLGFGQRNRTIGLEVNEQGCLHKRFEIVKVTPGLDFWTDKKEGCTPLSVKFLKTDIEESVSYYWNFGDGYHSTSEFPDHLFSNNTLKDTAFRVSLKVVSAEGCENTGYLINDIVVHPIPSVNLDFDVNSCYSDTITVFYKGSGTKNDTYFWDLGNLWPGELMTDPGKTPGPLRIYRKSKPELILGIAIESQFGCKSRPVQKNLKLKPVFMAFIDSAVGCPPLRVRFSAKTLIAKDTLVYTWDYGIGNPIKGNNISHLFTEPSHDYSVRVIANSMLTHCSDTINLTKAITTYPVPLAEFTFEPAIVPVSNSTIYFNNKTSGADIFQWEFGDRTSVSFDKNPKHHFGGIGINKVLLTAGNRFGCIDTVSHVVTVAFDRLFPPNAFSPNSPNAEDREFRIHSEGVINEGYSLLIYNRWGERIFESHSQNIGWDGKMKNGNPAPAGVYTWILEYVDFLRRKHAQQGTVTLLY